MLNLNTSILSALPFVLPPIEAQLSIATALSAFDDKIALNRQLNQTLEQMAQAIFQAWFVDFLPVRAKVAARAEGRDPLRAAMCALSGKPDAELDALPCERYAQLAATAALFPDELVETERGEVPRGWGMGGLDEFATLETSSVAPGREPDALFEHYSIPAFDAAGQPIFEHGGSIKSNKYRVQPGAVLVSKLNPVTPRVWLPAVKTARAVCSTEFMQFVPRRNYGREFLYLLMKSEPMQAEVLQRVTGSTGSRQRAQPSQIAVLPIVLPPPSVMIAFEAVVSPMLEAVAANRDQAELLAALRDALLPKLLSGEVGVRAASEVLAEEVRVGAEK